MFDYLKCDVPLPNGQRVSDFVFQTKSLYCNMHRLTVTDCGRLFLNRCRYEETGEREVTPGVIAPNYRCISLGDVDLNYHGDIEFHGGADTEVFQQWVARFTNGALEWIRPFDELNETHRDLLMAMD